MNNLLLLCFAALVAASSSLECGKRFHDQKLDKLQQWIVGGVTAMHGGYPYQVKSHSYAGWLSLSGTELRICNFYRVAIPIRLGVTAMQSVYS